MAEKTPGLQEGIEAVAAVEKVTTLADRGSRWVFDVPEGMAVESAWLMVAKEGGVAVRLHITAE